MAQLSQGSQGLYNVLSNTKAESTQGCDKYSYRTHCNSKQVTKLK